MALILVRKVVILEEGLKLLVACYGTIITAFWVRKVVILEEGLKLLHSSLLLPPSQRSPKGCNP